MLVKGREIDVNIKKILESVIFREVCEHYYDSIEDIELIKSYIYQTALDDENMYTFQMLILDTCNDVQWNVHGIIVDGAIIIRSRD